MNPETLKAACDAVLLDPALKPSPDGKVTHCNSAAQIVAKALGCDEFDDPKGAPIMANAMHAVMKANASGKWKPADGRSATLHALDGGLAFAAIVEEVHGHLAAIYPVGMQASGSLKKDVPMVANVGKTVGLMKVSGAFPVANGEPDYFVWGDS